MSAQALDFSDLQVEFAARGYNYDPATRAGYWLNRAYLRICNLYPWPFLEVNTTSTAPMVISDLGQILSVTDTTNDLTLTVIDRRSLLQTDPDLDDVGTPSRWYLEDTTLKVWPSNTTAQIAVRYQRVPTEMTAPTDEPLIPNRFRLLIVDCAVIYALEDDDEYASAQGVEQTFQQRLSEMVHALMQRNYQANPVIAQSQEAYL